MGGGEGIKSRKVRHLNWFSVNKDNPRASTLLDEVRLLPRPLAAVHHEQLDTATSFLGKPLSVPLFISSITGGMPEGGAFNHAVARVASKYGIGMCVGSVRAMLEQPQTTKSFDIKANTDVPFLGVNIGAVQAVSYGAERISRLMEELRGDALFVHLNKIQELAQPEGDRDFSALAHLSELFSAIPVPVILKETGSGFGAETAAAARQIGAAGLEVSGAGGTSFLDVEMEHLPPAAHQLWESFLDWGVPTAAAVRLSAGAGLPVIGSGGVRSGLDVARVIALGARLGGIAAPMVWEWHKNGIEGMERYIERLIDGLKITMTLTGASTIPDLASIPYMVGPLLAGWIPGGR